MMEDGPLVSIIVNCYNSEKYLDETIESILSQTYHNYEVIFWDNQSTDSTASIIKSYNDDRIHYYYASIHTTLGDARNMAVNKIKGQYLTFLDSDDVWINEFLERAIDTLSVSAGKCSFYYSNYYAWINGEELIRHNEDKKSGKRNFQDLLSKYKVGMSAAIIDVSRMKADNVKFDSRYQLIEDYDFFLRLAYKYNAYYDARPLMKYRMHSSSLTATQKAGWGEEFLCLYKDLVYSWLSVDEIKKYSKDLKWLKVRSVNANIEYLIYSRNRVAVFRKVITNIGLSPKLLIHFAYVVLPFTLYQKIISIFRKNIYHC